MRRRHLLTAVGVIGLAGLAGCTGSVRTPGTNASENDSPTTDVTDPVAPSDRVGSEAYLATLEARIESDRFPNPVPDLIPLLTEARFVSDAATAAESDEFVASVSDLRRPPFEPLENFDETVARARETEADDPEAFVKERLSRRERTFFDYPAPPHHFIEAARNRGRERLDATARREELKDAIGDESSTYVEHRVTIEAVVAGGTDLAREAYEERDEAEFPSGVEYDSAEHYADVITFNAALAAEAMLEYNGEIITPP